MTTATEGDTAPNLWRRAIHALAHAFDPAREGDYEGAVFQTSEAHARVERAVQADSSTNAIARQTIPPSTESLP
jgi:hypothetical protein